MPKMLTTLLTTAALAAAAPVAAQSYQPITDRATFLQSMGGKNLSNRLYGVNLQVTEDGGIVGTGAGWDITGTWSWQDSYFCREMSWGGDATAPRGVASAARDHRRRAAYV